MNDWSAEIITEPSPGKRISEKQLMKYTKCNNTPAIELENYPRHTQVVKQCVKVVSDVSLRTKTAVWVFRYTNQFASKYVKL